MWNVNPGAGNVSVIYAKTNKVVATIKTGEEPQSVALDPNNRYAYVANAGSGTVTVIRITRASAKRFRARVDRRRGTIRTGAEPWNIVVSPNGRRVFVANSGQGTITVIDTKGRRKKVIGHVNLQRSRCADPVDRKRQFQPRGLAVTKNGKRLLVTSFFAFTRPGGKQADDNGRQGVVCRLNVSTSSKRIRGYRAASRVTLAPQITGFTIDSNGDGVPDPTSAFPNQLQSIVIRGNQAYLPNIAASPNGPLRFNVDTQAFVSVIDRARSGTPVDAGVPKFLNLHLGARQPEAGKKKLFFANPWAIAFKKQTGATTGYVVSSGSDLLVKVAVDAAGKLTNTVDADTTRYIDLNDPLNPATSGDKAGKNPQGIVINKQGTRAYVVNFLSRNVSVVDLTNDSVVTVIRTAPLPAAGSPAEVVTVGAEMFFSSRGNFNRPAGATVSTTERLSSEGWQSCASCHFEGLTDSIVWEFGTGPRKSVPLNATFNPRNRNEQRVLNYSAIFDEVEDFEANIRNVSGPGPLAAPLPCSSAPPPVDKRARPQPRVAGRGQRRSQPRPVRAELSPPARQRGAPAAHRHAAGQHHRGAGADRAARVGEVRGPHSAGPVHAQGRRQPRLGEGDQGGADAVPGRRVHRLPRGRQVDPEHQELRVPASGDGGLHRDAGGVRRTGRGPVSEHLPA